VATSIAAKDFKKAMELRDPDFNDAFNAYIESTLHTQAVVSKSKKSLRIGIIHIGAPAGGLNAATRTAVRLCLNRGHIPIGIGNGFTGLIKDNVTELSWQDVNGWTTKGGSELGTNRDQPQPLKSFPHYSRTVTSAGGTFVDLGLIAFHLQKHNIEALLIMGGFESFSSALTLSHARPIYPAFCIPIIHLPATVSNNVPGTDFSIGSDTALNAIVSACDNIKLSAAASRKRVFVVEVQGGNCG